MGYFRLFKSTTTFKKTQNLTGNDKMWWWLMRKTGPHRTWYSKVEQTSSSVVAERPRDALCPSVVSLNKTSVISETIQNPPLVKCKTALKQITLLYIWRKAIFNMADGILTPCNLARSWHCFCQVTASCNVACSSGIVTVNIFTKWQHPAMWYVALGWHAIEFAQTFAILEFYIWFRFRPHHRHSAPPKFYPNRTTLGRKKWRHVDFQDGGSQPSWILGMQ